MGEFRINKKKEKRKEAKNKINGRTTNQHHTALKEELIILGAVPARIREKFKRKGKSIRTAPKEELRILGAVTARIRWPNILKTNKPLRFVLFE